MARSGALYSAFNGSKIEYTTSGGSSYSQIYGLQTIPDIGGEPNKIDTTDLDNTEFETEKMGLKPAQALNFDFNMEDPSVTANIKLVSDMEDSGDTYDFKLTYANGIYYTFSSIVKTTILGGSSGDLQKFTMHLSPNSEPVRTIPTTSI